MRIDPVDVPGEPLVLVDLAQEPVQRSCVEEAEVLESKDKKQFPRFK